MIGNHWHVLLEAEARSLDWRKVFVLLLLLFLLQVLVHQPFDAKERLLSDSGRLDFG